MKSRLYWFPLVLTAMLLVGAGGIARILFPPAAVLVGIYIFRRRRDLYMDAVLWCWFLSPLLRRLMDYQAGWKDPSIVLLTPYLLTLIAPCISWKTMLSSPLRPVLPIVLALIGITLGLLTGLGSQVPTAAVSAFLIWATPVLFAWWYASSTDEDKGFVKHSISRSVAPILLVVGVYGCLQFAFLPAWDRYWLTELNAISDIASMGKPEPFQLRVFSTFNSPGALALVLAPLLLFVTSIKGKLATCSAIAGFACLLLTQVRSGWLCFGIGALLLMIRMPRGLLRMGGIVVLTGLLTVFVGLSGPGSSMLEARLNSVSNLGNDTSALERRRGFSDAIQLILDHPAGLGLGVKEGVISDDGSFSLHDNGIIEALVTLGWLGGIAYLGALVALVFRKAGRGSDREDRLRANVIGVALLLQLPLGSVYLGPPGFVWLFVVLSAVGVESTTPVGGHLADFKISEAPQVSASS